MKKILSFLLVLVLGISFLGCDEFSSMINKVQTGASFYSEYTKYESIFKEADQMIADTETSITVGETSLPVAPADVLTDIYVMVDSENQLTYADVLIDGLEEEAVYEKDSNVVYLIDGTVVTPMVAVDGEQLFDADMDTSNILKEDFDPQSITGENLSEEGVYSFDINLNEALNLEELTEFLSQVTPEGFTAPTLDDAVAHIEIQFVETIIGEETEYQIDVSVSLTDYVIQFDDSVYVTISVVNHSILTVPVEFNFPQIFTDAYQFVAPSDVALANRPYLPEEVIDTPLVNAQDAYALLDLVAGDYEVGSANAANFSFQIFDAEMNEVVVTDGVFNIPSDGEYYILIQPLVDFQSDIVINPVVSE